MDQNNKNKAFISKWRIIGTDKTLKLPLIESGNYDFIVNWGDDTEEDHITTYKTSHTYPSEGIYQVSIIGTIVGWKATYKPGYKLLDVSQWGCLKLGNEGYYFYYCTEMDISATDAPDLSETTNLSYMFAYCMKMNGMIGHWDVSRVTNMLNMFRGASSFNQLLDLWNVSNVTNMESMFLGTSFNNDISGWNVSNVTNMGTMFYNASSFNHNISEWDVSRVTKINSMFDGASSFNQDISKWNVSNVTNMQSMFCGASAFNQDISKWDVSSVIDMSGMFSCASLFNQPLTSASGGWNVSRVTNMNWMFYKASSFNQDISQWDVSNIKYMRFMLEGAKTFITGPHLQKLENWNISTPELLSDILGYKQTISFRSRYLISWDKWVNKHSNKAFTEFICSICLTDLQKDEKWRTISCPALINQGIPHCFHKECIEQWFQLKQKEDITCPVCRRNAIVIN